MIRQQGLLKSTGLFILVILACAGTACGITATEHIKMPFGSAADVDYSGRLWEALESQRLVGGHAVTHKPFIGAAKPHGWILELAYKDLQVGKHNGFVVVKKNYNGPNLSVEDVEKNRGKYLSSITVMYQREKGYDTDNQDWFWAKYKPDGTLFSAPAGMRQLPLAGRVMKGNTRDKNRGCIYCHSSAGGGDYIFYPQIVIPPADGE